MTGHEVQGPTDTGGGTGTGRATTLPFAREGAAAVVSGRRLTPLEAVVSPNLQRGTRTCLA